MMILAHHIPGSDAYARIHFRRDDEFEFYALAALNMLRSLAGTGVHYLIEMGNRKRMGFT